MKALNNLKIQHRCFDCGLRTENYFCNLPPADLRILESLKVTNAYPKGATLYMEGQPSNGIYILCQGRVKLSTCSRDGKVIILRIAEAGEVLGLSAAVSDSFYETTAEVLEACQVNFVRKEDFLRFLQKDSEACLSAVKQLSQNYHSAYTQIRSFGLSSSIGDRLAKLFLGWCRAAAAAGRAGAKGAEAAGGGGNNIRLKISYTHEEIAEMIGTSRETVSRLLKDFRDRKLITLKGSDLIIHDKEKLKSAIGGGAGAARERTRQSL